MTTPRSTRPKCRARPIVIWRLAGAGFGLQDWSKLEILKLRQYAKDQLGAKFSLSNFHDEVLSAGALPMDVLSARIHEWVATQKAAALRPDGGKQAGGVSD